MSAASGPATDAHRRAWWLKTLHRWHWISAALSLVGMLGFSITGITLNHAAQISASPVVVTGAATLPDDVLGALRDDASRAVDARLPPTVRRWLAAEFDLDPGPRAAEWSDDEVYVSMPRAGGDAWLAIDLATGNLEFERTDRGWIAWFNDLHKGRNTGAGWRWFIDVFALACLVFCLTGLVLLQLHAHQRGLTWPMVGLGALVPIVLILLLVH